MGMRLLLRSNRLVSDAVRLFCGPAPQQRNSARGRGAMSNRRVDGAADHRMLRSMAATISNSRPGQPLARYSSRRLRHLGIEQVRTPFRAPRANAISGRWVKSVRAECLDHLFIFNETGLRRAMASYVSYFNHSRPHRSLGQRAPRDSTALPSRSTSSKIIAESILGGLHHVYRHAT